MGIQGIYGEIGKGRRISLAKLAVEHLATHRRALKIAIDISIWLFQIQASQGGASPAIRTLYFRLVRFLGHGIDPLFVFDGPDKPPFKRGAPTSSAEVSFTRPAKRLIGLFGFHHHNAPGEAEAECALLQRLGIVDMVLSEDVDTLAFGCTVAIKNWSAEGSRGSKAPTHVNMFTASEIKSGPSGLDREGMILVALMNGGDYLPAGIPGCGIKLACEAARAGFGHDLCEFSQDDDVGLTAWRERLCHELATNESGYFRTKHKALSIPDNFPDPIVLGYHAHPVVSSSEEVSELRKRIAIDAMIDVKGLRDFVDEEFNWKHLTGAKRFLRQLAPSLLAHKLRQQASLCKGTADLDEQTDREEHLIASILARRNHFSTDGIPEIKATYIPAFVVGLDLDQETMPEEEEPAELSEDEDDRGDYEDEREQRDKSPAKRNLILTWDPWAPDKAWILETIVRLGAPLSLERWDTAMQSGQVTEGKVRTKPKSTRGGMKNGAMDSYLRVAKPNPLTISQQQALIREAFGEPYDSNTRQNPELQKVQVQTKVGPTKQRLSHNVASNQRTGRKAPVKKAEARGRTTKKASVVSEAQNVNPWTLAQRQRAPVAEASRGGSTYDNSMATSSIQREHQVHTRLNQATPLGKSTHLNTVIRKSLEGTWTGTDDAAGIDVTPERLVAEVSLIDMTTDS